MASSAGLFAEDAGTRDDTMNIEWPAQHGAASFTTTLADPFKDWAVSQDAQRLTVTAYAANSGAIRFYQRNGFAPKSVELEMKL